MSEKTNLLKTFQRLWNQTSVPARVSVTGFAFLSVLALIGISYWLMQPHYVPFVNNLAPQKAAEVVTLLEAEGIANKRNFSGTGILVDQSKWNKANSLISSVVEPTQIESNPMSSSLLGDPTTRDHRVTRDLEIRLGKTIGQMTHIETARVHLGVPDSTPFLRDKRDKTASITVGLRNGTKLSQKYASAIISMVSRSVEGLSPENVSLNDNDGNTFSSNDSLEGAASGQLEYRHQVEQDLTRKAESFLEGLLGPGRAIVRLTADIDFTKHKFVVNEIDPDSRVVSTEIIETNKDTKDGGASALGVPGTGSNLSNGGRKRNQSEVVTSKEKLDKTFFFGTSEETRTIEPGQLKRLTIAVMVQLQDPPSVSGDAESGSQPKPPMLTKAEVEEAVKQAVGFDIKRDDQIEVLLVDQLAVTESIADLFLPPTMLETWTPLVKSASLGLAALVALILGLLTISKIKSAVPIEPANTTSVTPERARQLSELSLLARKNPEVLGNILAAWAGDGEDSLQIKKAA